MSHRCWICCDFTEPHDAIPWVLEGVSPVDSSWKLMGILQCIFLQKKWNLTGSTMFNPRVFLVISARRIGGKKIHDFWQMISMFAGYIPKYPQFLFVNLVRRLQKRARPKLYPRIFSERSFFFSWFSWAIPNHPKAIFQIHGLYMFTLWLFNIALENHHAIGKPSMSMGHLYHGYVK